MAFYGESYPLLEAWAVTRAGGLSAGGADLTNHFDGRSDTLVAGDVIVAAIQPDPVELTATDAAAISWVIETGPGSAGVLRLTAGDDPTWPLPHSSGAALDQPLGDFTATGAGTIVAGPVTGLSAGDLVDWTTTPELRVEVLSGSVEVVQVKLRVWPPGGVTGGWVPAGDGATVGHEVLRWNTLTVPESDNSGLVTATVDHESYPDPMADDAALDAETQAMVLLAGKVGEMAYFGSVGYAKDGELASAQSGAQADLFVLYAAPNQYFYTGQAYARAGLGLIKADIADARPAVDLAALGAIPDPHEHQYEPEAITRPAGGGRLQPRFAGWTTAAVEVTYSTSVEPTSWAKTAALLRVQGVSTDFTPQVNPATGQHGLPYQIATVGQVTPIKPILLQPSVVQRVPLTGEQALLVSVVTPGTEPFGESARGLEDADFFGDPVHAYGFNVEARVDVVDTGHLVTFGPIEVWNPNAKPTRKPRFYVTFTEVDDDPRDVSHVVGIGKPADDLSIFRVPTPLGTLRELRHGEKVSDVSVAYPLKVKLEDGSWTIVAGMTPDD